jgi:hypothetical protein
MHKQILALLFCSASIGTFAQPNPQKYGNSITKAGLQKQLSVIASADMEGRETGTEGQRKAAAYIVSQFKAMGLKPAPGTDNYQQYYAVGYDTLLNSKLTIDGINLMQGKEYADETALNNNGTVAASEIIFVGYGISDANYDDYAGKDVKGKIVLFFGSEPKKQDGSFIVSGNKNYSSWTYPGGLSQKAATAKQKGAVAAIIINTNMDSITPNYAKTSLKSNMRLIKAGNETVNCITVGTGKGKSILGEALSDTLVMKAKNKETLNGISFSKKAQISYSFNEQQVTVNASNVAGFIEGTDKKDELVILTGHYDHLGMRNGKIYYGADDDGSGTCAVLEMAAAFAKAKADGKGPRRTVLFMTVSGEEKGLWGSEYYSEHPLFPLDKTSVDLNTDMVGRIDTERKTADSLNYVYVIGHDKLSSELPIINEAANTKNTGLVLDYLFDDPNDKNRIYYRSDHYNFARKGVPILFFYDGMLKSDYHQPTDTIDKIYWDLYEKRVRMIFYTAWEMANRNAMIKRDIPLN